MIYKASIIGLGNIAWKYDKGISDSYVRTHAECYLKDAKTNLKGGVSPCKKELDEFTDYYHLEKYKNIEYLLKDKQDIVSICSPSEFHFQQVKRCILSGVPMIWLEKPATTNIYELEELIDLADKFNTKVLVNYQRRYCSNYINLKKIFKEEHFGKPLNIHLTYSRGLLINGSHILDILSYILDDKKSIALDIITQSVRNNPSFTMKTNSDIMINVTGYDLTYHNIDIEITFEKGRCAILHGGMTNRIEQRIEHELFHGFYRLKEVSSDKLGQAGFTYSLEKGLSDLIYSYENDSQPVSNLKSCYNSQKIINKVLSEIL